MIPLNDILKDKHTPKEHRDCLVDLANGIYGCCVRYKDGSLHQVTVKNDEISIDDYDPWYEFDDQSELENYIKTDNEEFDNYIRWKKLEKILNDPYEDPFKKE